MNRVNFYCISFIALILFQACTAKQDVHEYLKQYNVIWNSQSENSSESMPFGGGDIGGNVWVEDNHLYFYLQRSGCFSDNGEYLKLGRYRVTLFPNPFENCRECKQELHLAEGYVSIKAKNNTPRRYPTFWGPGHDWVPDHNWGGSGMIGLQEMLMQTVDEKIYLLPAWPKGKDVCFKLHAPYNTIIELEYIGGEVVKLKVFPENRKKDVEIL